MAFASPEAPPGPPVLEDGYAARRRKLAVPDDLSVVGFDNLPEAALTDPPVTTVDQSVEQMGHTATRLLIERLDDPSREPVEVTLPTELVVRASSGPIGDRTSTAARDDAAEL